MFVNEYVGSIVPRTVSSYNYSMFVNEYVGSIVPRVVSLYNYSMFVMNMLAVLYT